MTSWLGASFLAAGFLVLLKVFRLVERGRDSLSVVGQSLGRMTDRLLDDDARERAMRAYSLRLFGLAGALALFGAAAALIPYGMLWLCARAGWIDLGAILAVAFSWPFLSISFVVTGLVLWLIARGGRPGAEREGFEINYSATDRLLHQTAFATTGIQTAAASLEDRLFRRRIGSVAMARPVFICGLPRAGTTMLLDLCARLPGIVTHTYREMPFLHLPILWNGFARAFRTADVPRERAHGDGMLVSVDSPEALEESLWIGFWLKHYKSDRIRPWRAEERNERFVRFFAQHMRKLACTRGETAGRAGEMRYVSKNNLNIARVGWLHAAFPDARILVPFREPVQHAASLHRQHLNFLAIHRRDDFARQYMAAIGHFDFGANLRPIDFDGWLKDQVPGAPLELEFWIRYWIAAHRHLAAQENERLRLMSYDAFCAAPGPALGAVADFLGFEERGLFLVAQDEIHATKTHPVELSGIDPAILEEARLLHERLMERSLASL